MEQVKKNEQEISAKDTKDIKFWDKPSVRVVVFMGVVGIIVWYFVVWVPRQECALKITYHPAGSPIHVSNHFGRSVLSENEFYSFRSEDFKTKKEAVNQCVHSQ